jgi:hypothetical protein
VIGCREVEEPVTPGGTVLTRRDASPIRLLRPLAELSCTAFPRVGRP